MSERDTADLLRGATDDLEPDVERLVAGALARGRVRVRRRRVATGLAALAGVAVIGTAAGLALGGGDQRAFDPAAPTSTAPTAPTASTAPTARSESPPTSPSASTDRSYGDTAPRDLAVRAADLPALFTDVFPGDAQALDVPENPREQFDPRVTDGVDLSGEPGPGIATDFSWNGYYARVAVAPTEPTAGDSPLERCEASTELDTPCVVQADGGVLQQGSVTPPGDSGEATTSSVSYYTPDKWQVTAFVTNSDPDSGELLGDEPPLTPDELTALVTSDVWFAG